MQNCFVMNFLTNFLPLFLNIFDPKEKKNFFSSSSKFLIKLLKKIFGMDKTKCKISGKVESYKKSMILMGFEFFMFILFIFVGYKTNEQLLLLSQMESAFYMFTSPLDFSVQTKKIEYFHGIQRYSENLLCNFVVSTKGCNSTPRDIVISSAVSKTTNIVLFQRTLRTTGTNATLILFLDQEAIDNMDPDTKRFTEQMNTQIFLIPKPPSSGMKIKNFIAYLVKEFLRENEFNINRVIVMDLFDSLFQEDPFNIQMPNDKLQLVHENIYNKDNSGTKDFIKSTIEDFTFDNRTGAIETINAQESQAI